MKLINFKSLFDLLEPVKNMRLILAALSVIIKQCFLGYIFIYMYVCVCYME